VPEQLQTATRDLGAKGPDEVFGHGLILPADPCN
jgi:hypothetical protein